MRVVVCWHRWMKPFSTLCPTDGKLHADDTPVPVLLPGNKKTKTGRLWTYVRTTTNAGSALAPAVWFAYSPDRKGIHPQTHLARASVAYCRLMPTPGSTSSPRRPYKGSRVLGHARRKSTMFTSYPSALTEEAPKRIGELYAIGRSSEVKEQRNGRQSGTKKCCRCWRHWRVAAEKQKTLSRHSELAKAFGYALNQWPALTRYAEDGWVEVDNNIAENALRLVSLGRKTGCSSARIMVVSAVRHCTVLSGRTN